MGICIYIWNLATESEVADTEGSTATPVSSQEFFVSIGLQARCGARILPTGRLRCQSQSPTIMAVAGYRKKIEDINGSYLCHTQMIRR